MRGSTKKYPKRVRKESAGFEAHQDPRESLNRNVACVFAKVYQDVRMLSAIWLPGETHPDHHSAFRGKFELSADASIEIRLLGASFFEVSLDDEFLTQGPIRILWC
jgi:hypothetical protein